MAEIRPTTKNVSNPAQKLANSGIYINGPTTHQLVQHTQHPAPWREPAMGSTSWKVILTGTSRASSEVDETLRQVTSMVVTMMVNQVQGRNIWMRTVHPSWLLLLHPRARPECWTHPMEQQHCSVYRTQMRKQFNNKDVKGRVTNSSIEQNTK